MESLNRPADVEVDAAAREPCVTDGSGNRRVVVFDAELGVYKRHWGAYGELRTTNRCRPTTRLGRWRVASTTRYTA
jgi:hypothetical protein